MTARATLVPTETETATRLQRIASVRFQRSVYVGIDFFDRRADDVALACLEMARRFRRGGRLLVFGTGAGATDAQHVSVEFVHPVLVGKRALPAIALTSDVSTLTAARCGALHDGFGAVLEVLGRPQDIAMAISSGGMDPVVEHGLERARAIGMLTLALTAPSPPGEPAPVADFIFVVPTDDPFVVQEVHETLYHILWELVHVFLDHTASDDQAEETRDA